MTILQATILGIVQGITELLPISSSGHLNLIPLMLGWKMPESFDVALHLGTLLAITIFFLYLDRSPNLLFCIFPNRFFHPFSSLLQYSFFNYFSVFRLF